MEIARRADGEQSTLWNGVAGHAWVELQALLDELFKPFETMLVEAVVAASSSRALDVGCGTGGTALAIARRLAARGCCSGIDISAPMLAAARTRATREDLAAEFICADAQDHAFEPASFDMIVSRFGVMFFSDPIKAFANLRRAASDDAALRCVTWRGATENPFMTTAERAAAPLLPDIPAREPGGPGQFAFAEPRRVTDILERSGWADIHLEPLDVPCAFPETQLVPYFTQLGPLGRVFPQAGAQTRRQIIDKVRAAFAPYVSGGEVRFEAACWRVAARPA